MAGFDRIADDILRELGVECYIQVFDTGSFNVETGETDKTLLYAYSSFCAIVKSDFGSFQSNSVQLNTRSTGKKMTYITNDITMTILLSTFGEAITEDTVITIYGTDYCVNPFEIVMDQMERALYKIPLSIKK